MPDRRAASRFPPIAYIARPEYVRRRTKPVINAAATSTSTGYGRKPNSSPLPSSATQPPTPMGRPSAITSARPRAIESIARVAMNEGIRPTVISSPETTPASVPAARPTITASHSGSPALVAVQPMTIPDSPATEPTERSMPPLTITNVIPKASTATTAACTPTLSRLFAPRKSGDAIESASTSRISAATGPPAVRTAVHARCRSDDARDPPSVRAGRCVQESPSGVFSGTFVILPSPRAP